MSQYPYGYPFQGQPPQQQYLPYPPYNTYSTPNSYAAQPSQQYSQQQPQSSSSGNYFAASQSAYNHNANSIPGLGIPSAAPALAAPFNESWNQGHGTSTPHVPHFPYNPQASTSQAVPSHSNGHSQTLIAPSPAPIAGNTQTLHEAQVKELPQDTANQKSKATEPDPTGSDEEGEVSDPDFDDLYDDVPSQAAAASQLSNASAKPTEYVTASNSDQEPDFYDTEVDENATSKPTTSASTGFAPQQITKQSDDAERDRSRSYSPYLSPTEIKQDKLATSQVSMAEAEGTGNASSETANPASNSHSTLPINETPKTQAVTLGQDANPLAAASGSATEPNASRAYANVSEAQNEAKKAILRLLPHGVKFHTYIDEGFDAKLVKDLFSQLNLPTDPAVTLSSDDSATMQDKENLNPAAEKSSSSQIDSAAKKQEERKDKIARLLAEKKAKAAVAARNTGSTTEVKSVMNTTSQASITPTKPSKTRVEMDRLLQQKMQALREKAAQKPSASSTPKPIIDDKPTTPAMTATPNGAVKRLESTVGTPAYMNIGASPARESSQSLRGSSDTPNPPRSHVPSAPKGAQVVSQRKRPVAADFMDYPPTSIKRPSLANRQNSSLVISLSDDEGDDDDDDIEMDVDSAEDSPAPTPQSITLPKRGPSIRDYPPLTNRNSPRHLASPASAASPIGGNVDLQARERQIVELKRRIQEAEARAKNKPKKGSATPHSPSAGNITPTEQSSKSHMGRILSSSDIDDKGGPSAQLLQEAEAAAATFRQASENSSVQQVEGGPPSRVSSVQLPGRSDKLREKAERLRKMQEEMMKLQAEINEDMAEEEVLGDYIGGSTEDADMAYTPRASQPVEDPTDFDANKSSHMIPENYDITQQPNPPLPTVSASTETPEDQEENMDMSSNVSSDASTPPSPKVSTESASLSPKPASQERVESGAEDQGIEAAETMADRSSGEADIAGIADGNVSDDYEPPEAQLDDRAAQSSPPFSPPPADRPDSNAGNQRQTNADLQKRLVELRNQLISAKASKDQMSLKQSFNAEEMNREVHRVSSTLFDSLLTQSKANNNASPTPNTSFVPYDSPLRYFRAYRFHPRYSDDVASGLKSLTYSSRIDPKREICPDELDGTECPRGDACQFQHFRSIVAPDNEIILDLGSSDDLAGDQKKNFNNGLRELVASFQQSRVRDFGTIAQAIVEFRRRFLGDTSKVLRLQGINI